MKKLLTTIFAYLLLTTMASATQYYISTTGSDSNNGAIGTPFLTIQKCANTAVAGDTCSANNGTYRELVTLPASGTNGNPITFTCVNPLGCTLSGSNLATGWSLSSGSIYNSNIGNISGFNQVYVDGVFIDQARYPQTALLTTTSTGTSTQVISTAIGTGGSNVLTSAQVVNATPFLRINEWTWDSSTTATAFNVATGTITVSPAPYFGATMLSAWGFYLSAANGSGLTWMLTYPGAWYYDNSNVLSLQTIGSDSPSSHTVEVAARSYGFNISSKNYITITNMNINYPLTAGINISTGNNRIITGNSFLGGYRSIWIQTGTNDTVNNNTWTSPLFAGLNGNTTTNLIANGNTCINAGNVGSPKVGRSEGGCIFVTGASNVNFTAKNNTINGSGYCGIGFNSNGYTIENNVINNSCQVLDDCAAIYFNNNQTKQSWTGVIDGNIINHTASNTYIGTQYSVSDSNGIYADDLTSGASIFNNKINDVDYGILLHSTYNNFVTNNTITASRQYGLLGVESGSISGEVAGVMVNNIIKYNTFESLSNNGLTSYGGGVMAFWSKFLTTDIANFGKFDYNQLCNPNNGGTAVSTQGQSPGFGDTNYTLSAWKSYANQDANSAYQNNLCPSKDHVSMTGKVTITGNVTIN